VLPAPDTFQNVDLSYTTAPGDPHLGSPLSIRILTTIGQQGNDTIYTTFIDNVALDASPVPEPSTFVLLLTAAAPLMLRRRPCRS
jgi:hypothetical protein